MTTKKKIQKVPFLSFIANSGKITRDPLNYHKEYYKKYGDTFTILELKNPVMLSRDVNVAEHILKKNHRNYHKSPYQSKNLSEYIGNGLLTANGDYWLQQRRLIQPAFHKERLEKLLKIIDDTIVAHIKEFPKNQMISALPLMSNLAFDVVAKSLFQLETIDDEMEELKAIIADIQVFIVTEIRQPHKRWWFQFNGSKGHNMQLVARSREIILNVIKARRTSEASHDDLLQMLLDARYEDGSGMSDETLIDEIIILFVAGHETSANALTFTLHLLAQNPDKIQKIKNEVDTATNSSKEFLERLKQFEYTKACVEESLRLYPPAWVTDRVALEDDQIGDFEIKAGTTIGVSFYEIHRDPQFWTDAEKFVPERFLGDLRKESMKHFYPFGAGPRICIGNNFAMFEMIIAIAKIVAHFSITTDTNKITLKPLIALKPEGVNIKFTPL